MNSTIKIKGLRELDRDIRKLDKDLSTKLRDELKDAAEPVAASARDKVSVYRGASVDTIRPIALAKGVVVRQTARKVTGKRGDFGSLQMRRLISAADENEAEVERRVEAFLDTVIRRNGF